MPDRNAQWIIGTFIAVAIALSMQTAGLRTEMNQLRTEMSRLRTEMNQRFSEMNQRFSEMNQRFSEVNRRLDSFDERLHSVEIAFAKVDQRLEIIERVVLPDAPAPQE